MKQLLYMYQNLKFKDGQTGHGGRNPSAEFCPALFTCRSEQITGCVSDYFWADVLTASFFLAPAFSNFSLLDLSLSSFVPL